MSVHIPDYFRQPLEQFVADTAAKQPIPGGGSVTALAALHGVSLARMTIAYTLGSSKLADVHDRVRVLDARLAEAERLFREMVAEDMQAYLAYAEARKATADSPEDRQRRKQATLAALAVPTEMVALASSVLSTCDDLKELVTRFLLSDLLAAAHLLHGAAHAAAVNARLNLKSVDEDRIVATYRTQITSALSHADLRLASVRASVTKTLALYS